MQLSAGIVIVRQDGDHRLYLLLRAYNYWDFPKGLVEEGETPFEAARRETFEETGIRNLSFRWGRVFKETEPYNNGRKRARYYLAETSESTVTFSVNPELGRPEHHEYRWIAVNEVKELVGERLHPVIEWAEKTITQSS